MYVFPWPQNTKPSAAFTYYVPFSINISLYFFIWLKFLSTIFDLIENLSLRRILLFFHSTVINGFNDLMSWSKIKRLGWVDEWHQVSHLLLNFFVSQLLPIIWCFKFWVPQPKCISSLLYPIRLLFSISIPTQVDFIPDKNNRVIDSVGAKYPFDLIISDSNSIICSIWQIFKKQDGIYIVTITLFNVVQPLDDENLLEPVKILLFGHSFQPVVSCSHSVVDFTKNWKDRQSCGVIWSFNCW